MVGLTLVGDNLGQRHQCLNNFVNNIYQENAPLRPVLEQHEVTPIDRIFKIDLASKHRDVEFIIKNLKEKDMLYVSRALKYRWLLETEYADIINPNYLESQLYPEMTTTAVNKMKNWIELNLKDPKRCETFYEYYKNNYDIAIKYLWHCSKDFIIKEVSGIIDRLTPKQLRILSEGCPQVAKIYYDGLQNNQSALRRYINSQTKYFKSIMKVLKVDGDLFLNLIEKYFDKSVLNRLSPSATAYIMKNYKTRYLTKPELYAGLLLDVKTLALYLSSEEIIDIVTRLAHAKYLFESYKYKQAEPLIKRLSEKERVSIKKKIFVDKSFENQIKLWPYPAPEGIELSQSDCQPLVDTKHDAYEYENLGNDQVSRSGFSKMKISKRCYSYQTVMLQSIHCLGDAYTQRGVSSLDTLFNRYRFVSFDKVFFEFRKLLLAEGTIEGRRNMMLVLVSKASGIEAKMEQLLKLLVERHSNEPENLRDAIARSMVKRAFVWRLSAETWELLLRWATTSVTEILHTKVLRHLLADSPIPPRDFEAYLRDFSDFTEYTLNATEKSCVAKRLPVLLISANDPKLLLQIVKAYNLRVGSLPGAEDMLVAAARKDETILRNIYDSRLARRQLLKDSFKILQTDAAYVNALRHDVSVLENGESFVALISKEKSNHDRFLRALVLYFSEPDGLAVQHFAGLEKVVNDECRQSFARPFAFLMGVGNKSLMHYINRKGMKFNEPSKNKFGAALRAHACVARPLIDIDILDWRAIGVKLVSNIALTCSDRDVDRYIQKSLQWKGTMRVAMRLAIRSHSATEILTTVAEARPTAALKLFLTDLRAQRAVDISLWNQIKPIILNLDLSKKPLQHLRRALADADFGDLNMLSIEADYWTAIFIAQHKTSELRAMPMLCSMENLLTEVDENLLKNIILKFINDKLNDNVTSNDDFPEECVSLYFRIIAKYLLTCKTVDEQKVKIETVCDPFFDKIQEILNKSKRRSEFYKCLDDFLASLKYSQGFLSTKYVSCIPIFQKTLERLEKILPRDKYFKKYVYIHVTMLYYKSLKHALIQKPQIFENLKSIQGDAVKELGLVLGKNIGIEIQELVRSYFKSITAIYQKGFVDFFQSFEYNESREMFIESVVRGLVGVQGDAQLLAEYLFAKTYFQQESEEIQKLLKDADNEELKFFLYADDYPR